jgi:hypothetical protein
MTEPPIEDEIRTLAERIAAGPDEVADLAADAVQLYRRERMIVLGLIGVDAMVSGDDREVAEIDPRLRAPRERLRDRLRALLAWGKEPGRM